MTVSPLILASDNFTPATRTPWGGTRMVAGYKRFLAAGDHPAPISLDRIVGEAWELSATPEFPSRTQGGQLLRECIAADPGAWLGREADRGGTALLLKWLDAADNLSVQIHPTDAYPKLAADQAGKPECWYIVEATPGAGLYLGLQQGASREAMAAALQRGDGSVAELLRFTPVSPGDFFLLDPGMPHAIGQGVMLLEPQFVQPGRKGVTYRYWDWDRCYDSAGKRDPSGQPRPLHVDDALAVTDFERACDPDFLAARRRRLGAPALDAPPALAPLSGPLPEDGVENHFLQVARLSGTGETCLPDWDALRGVTLVEGAMQLGELRVQRGQTLAVPAVSGPMPVVLDGAHAIVAATL